MSLYFGNIQQLAIDIDVTYDFRNIINHLVDTSVRKDYWQNVDILPAGNRSGVKIIVNISYDLTEGGAGPNSTKFYYGLGLDSTTEPSVWTLVDTSPSSGTLNIEINSGEYLFVRIDADADSAPLNFATGDLTLIDGSVVSPNTGTVLASGSPLNWIVSVSIP